MRSNGPTSVKSDRVGAVRRLQQRKYRRREKRFLAEGAQSVAEALRWYPECVEEVFVAADSELAHSADSAGHRVTDVPEHVLGSMTETVSPQGVLAVCRELPFSPPENPRLIAVLHDIRDPGNAGTILRTADAAGADAVYFTGDSVDPYNGKCVRASAGSLFHIPFVACSLADVPFAGLQVLATSGAGARDIRDLDLTVPTAWLFGNEAHGLPELGFQTVSVPIFGEAESLNLAAAAAVCLYASALARN